MTTQELQAISKDTQKFVLKIMSEFPTLSINELTGLIQSRGKKISQEEVTQIIQGISPSKNWQRAEENEIQEEILKYVWTLETQILFLFPTKQKETSTADFNQIRLQNKQSKAPKDLIRHIQSLLMVEGKNLARFRKLQKEFSYQNDLDSNTQAIWAVRILVPQISLNSITNLNSLTNSLIDELRSKFPNVAENSGKTLPRIVERFIEKYIPKTYSDQRLKELISSYQSILNSYKNSQSSEISTQCESLDQGKVFKDIIENLKSVQEEIRQSHEGGFLSKLFAGKIKNREGLIEKIGDAIESFTELNEQNLRSQKLSNEKALLLQKVQSEHDALLIAKSQLENDLFSINEKLNTEEEKNTTSCKELNLTTESLEKAHEKIAMLQQKIDELTSASEKSESLKTDLATAKNIAISLYSRINKLKTEILRQEKASA